MNRTGSIHLDDGRTLEYEMLPSSRAKAMRLKMTARDGLTVVVPKGVSESRVEELVADKSEWITEKLIHFDEVRDLLGHQPTAKPEAFELAALAESWRVEYIPGKASTVAAKSDQSGRLKVYGAINETERCHAALRRWVSRRAKDYLPGQLAKHANELGFAYHRIAIKNQRTRWGSCSSTGTINLNCKLLFLSPELVRYVLIHELCHLQHANHSPQFWALVRQCAPNTDRLHEIIRNAWKCVPPWMMTKRVQATMSNQSQRTGNDEVLSGDKCFKKLTKDTSMRGH